ncbi:glutamate dehydrogenase 2-like [Hibiscus syriacus]|uniref:Glutamate dehydrogenase 2-like n=1 Tax=Hibiscus syriacus TaxID=106335 RepID=A0A6A3BXL4_HIBSY|nr:glutamate dehydrogenase 2-like [Hibiscus syriacus]
MQGGYMYAQKIASKDHKLVYWVAGALSAFSVLLVKKSRRSELAQYVLPRATESLWYISINRHLLPDVKNAKVALFCACMGGLMYYLEYEPDSMAPFLKGLLRRFLSCRISNQGTTFDRTASYTYLQTLDAMKKPKPEDNQEFETLIPKQYSLEPIHGL